MQQKEFYILIAQVSKRTLVTAIDTVTSSKIVVDEKDIYNPMEAAVTIEEIEDDLDQEEDGFPEVTTGQEDELSQPDLDRLADVATITPEKVLSASVSSQEPTSTDEIIAQVDPKVDFSDDLEERTKETTPELVEQESLTEEESIESKQK